MRESGRHIFGQLCSVFLIQGSVGLEQTPQLKQLHLVLQVTLVVADTPRHTADCIKIDQLHLVLQVTLVIADTP